MRSCFHQQIFFFTNKKRAHRKGRLSEVQWTGASTSSPSLPLVCQTQKAGPQGGCRVHSAPSQEKVSRGPTWNQIVKVTQAPLSSRKRLTSTNLSYPDISFKSVRWCRSQLWTKPQYQQGQETTQACFKAINFHWLCLPKPCMCNKAHSLKHSSRRLRSAAASFF